MGSRVGIHTTNALGVSMAHMKRLAALIDRDHWLAGALWATELYEARIVASMVDEPMRVSSTQMDRWCRDFDNWAICDTVCFNLFDRAPGAWSKVGVWSRQPEQFVKRGAFALLWSLALHDHAAPDDAFVQALGHVEREAVDDRPMVQKSIVMALNAVGRRNLVLRDAASASAHRLAASPEASARRLGRAATKRLLRA
jgi:3-methyladenine DNA glycosylase AlkD